MRFEIVSINPGLIVGPNLLNQKMHKFASGDLIDFMMMRKLFAIPRSKMGLIDVRDCAQAHI